MAFFCLRCGECCHHMRLLFRVEQTAESGGGRYVIHHLYTGERTPVRIDPDRVQLFRDRSILRRLPDACPFLREDPATRLAVCTVHATRPDLCREFGCWRLLILGPGGDPAGRIMGSRHLVTCDRALMRLWHAWREVQRACEDASWDRELVRFLSGHGYRVIAA